jgi:hypothetical protein
VGFYGSSGYTLVLTPSSPPVPTDLEAIAGPAIEMKVFHGDTSRRFAVARVVARIFPAEQAFVQRGAGEEFVPAGGVPAVPYPSDRVIYRAARVAEFETAARSEGLGTASRLIANDAPVLGVAMLKGAAPNLITLAVRLPPELGALAAPIIAEFIRREGAPVPTQ